MASKAIQETVHAMLGPSACHRWAYCPASVLLTKDLPNETSQYAEEGTKAHRVAELRLKALWCLDLDKKDEAEYQAIKAELPGVEDHIRKYTDAILDVERGREVYFHAAEVKLPITPITYEKSAFGTADCVTIVGEFGKPDVPPVLHIFDLKYGSGVKVSAEQNSQLAMYALAALTEFDDGGLFYAIETVKLHIVQPRMDNISEWSISRKGLEGKFLENIRRAANRAHALLHHPESLVERWPFVPIVEKRVTYDEQKKSGKTEKIVINTRGDFSSPAEAETVCRWCRAKATCPVLRQQLADTLAQDFEDLPKEAVPSNVPAELRAELKEIPVPDTPERLGAAYRYVPMIRDWCDAVEASARSRLTNGDAVPGLKLVAGRQGPRKWSDAKEAEEILRRALRVDEVYDRKVISPTAAEKLMKDGRIKERNWAKLSSLISRAEGKPSVVPEDDPREEIAPQIENDFESL